MDEKIPFDVVFFEWFSFVQAHLHRKKNCVYNVVDDLGSINSFLINNN